MNVVIVAMTFGTTIALPVLLLLPPVALLSQTVSLTALTLLSLLAAVGLASLLAVTSVVGLEPADGVVLKLVEDRTGLRIPFVRGVLPSEAARDGGTSRACRESEPVPTGVGTLVPSIGHRIRIITKPDYWLGSPMVVDAAIRRAST